MSPSSHLFPLQGGNATSAEIAMSNLANANGHGHPHIYDIPPLEDDWNNYLSWKYQAEMVLSLQGLWAIVDGTLPKPDPSADPTAVADWSHKDRNAHAQIALSLKDGPLNTVCGATSARECWDKLSVRYHGRWKPQLVHLIDEVFRSTFSDSKPLQPQIDSLMHSSRIISSLGITLDDKLVAFAIISSLPRSLSTLRTILLITNPSELSTEYVRSQLISDEQRRVRESGMGTTAYFSRAAKKGKARPQ
jgi:gag-polypeptide of LTR copia-type